MNHPRLELKRLSPHATAPKYMSEAAAGLDLAAALADPATPMVIAPGERAAVPTGWAMAIPPGYEGQVRPRSGLALRYGLTVVNAPGTIDADYRGEVKVLVVNLGSAAVTIESGMRIAQLVIAPIARAEVELVEALTETVRGEGGFGSTGRGSSG